MSKESIILFAAGILTILLSHPRFSRPAITRLFNEGVITPKRVKPEKSEVIKYAGPSLSLFLIGIILIIIGFLLI